MKIIKTLALIAALAIASPLSAQITYKNGRLNFNQAPKHDFLDMLIHNWNGLYWTSGSSNFLQIDVSPSNPRIAGTGDKIVFFNSVTGRYNSIQVANLYQQSDARSKTDIHDISQSLPTILELRPVSYKWKPNSQEKAFKSSNSISSDSLSIAYGPESETQLQYGFLAQDIEKVIPEIVAEDSYGNKMVNYTAIIPMLVNAVQELQKTVENQAVTIAELSANQLNAKAVKSSNERISGCTPNPTSNYVTIDIDAQSYDNLEIIITNLAGNRQLTAKADSKSISINVSSLEPGIHIVSLTKTGAVIDTCRLIKQ